jgi:hypothetical protein
MPATVEFSGPFFDARLDVAADELNHDLEDTVAQQAMADWHENLDRSLRHPTGFYESHVTMRSSPSGSGGTIVTDLGVIYGHWLEGDGSRNAPKTRFPGYWSARRATAQVQGKVESLARGPIDRFTEKVNGGA